PSATMFELHTAAKRAYAYDFITRFELGFDTPVGENGVQLSCGEKRRLAVARAMLRDAPIMLLDEAAAGLESESERAVEASLDAWIAERRPTTLRITHDLR